MSHKIAYIISRFPTITETFVLYEILELQRLGLKIDIFSLIHEKDTDIQPGAEKLLDRVYYPSFNLSLLLAQLYWLWKAPLKYIKTWFRVIAGNIKSPKFLLRGIGGVLIATEFARHIEDSDIKHMHAHFATHTTLVAYVISQLTGVSYSVTAHAHDIFVDRSMLEEKLTESSLTITISDYNRNLLNELYGQKISDKVQVIHCGIDVDIFKPRPEKQGSDILHIVCVGSLRDYKGQKYLIEACAKLKDRTIPFNCTFVGDGDDRSALEALVKALHLEDSVHLTGYKTSDQVIKYLYQADVFVLPSIITPSGKMEGIPVALMEALAMTMPVITTSISGIPELVIHNETGILVPPQNADELADALIYIYENPETARILGEKGREHVIEQFNLKKNSNRMHQTLVTVIENSL